MTTAAPIVSRKRDMVRSHLARVAIELFTREGFDAVTVDEIARAADISARTFFRYFAGKDEIVLEFQARLFDRLLAAFDERPDSEGPVEALWEAYKLTSTVAPEDRGHLLQLGRILGSAPSLRAASFGQVWTDGAPLVARMASRMKARPKDPRPRIIVAAMSAVATAEWHAWVDEGGSGDPAARIDAALELLAAGLTTLEQAGRADGRKR